MVTSTSIIAKPEHGDDVWSEPDEQHEAEELDKALGRDKAEELDKR
jgi:hypothetical protein